jgi:predicted GNAT family N-acyltransferase
MKLQDFHVQVADWSCQSDRLALQEVRHTVFVLEQGVPPEKERDALDAGAWHVLARDLSGRPIGCGRLTDDGSIGRLAVLPDWRGRELGTALLRGLVEHAQALGWPQASLTALASATGFYARAGFRAVGDAFTEAGLPHQTMRLALTSAPLLSRNASHRIALPAGNRDELAAARLQLLTRTKHRLAIELPRLDAELYSSSEELDELRRIATAGRGSQIRILLHDPAAALRDGHRLLPLAQRLTSVLLVRHPVEEADLASTSSCLLTDAGGYLFQPDAERPQGRAALADRAALAPLEQRFDERWERAARAGMLQPLDL